MKPFLKWAGGKTQLLETIKEKLPENIYDCNRYVEPFIGGGAVFLDFLEEDLFEEYLINDINTRLIILYKIIKERPDELINELKVIKNEYLELGVDSPEREEFFYNIRDQFNSITDELLLATYFIFLNKTCFNGLYRENAKGKFNVPFGRYKNPNFVKEEQILKLSRLLNQKKQNGEERVIILNKHFFDLGEFINENTFVYMDPPYRPVTVGGFSTYNKSGFNDENQKELCEFYKLLDSKGSKLMLSNSDPKNLDEDDEFFDELYKNFNIERTYARRSINSKGSSRHDIAELLILNYEYKGVESKMDMSMSKVYKEQLNFTNNEEVFESLVNDVKDTIKGWNYFVNWEKAIGNLKEVEKSLNVLNYLIGKEDIEKEAKELIKEYPNVINVFPILVATRDKDFKILEPTPEDLMNFKEFNFKKKSAKDTLTNKEINDAVEFLKKTNLLKLFQDKTIKNLVDYVLGVEVGLDSNARKNRTGTAMEDIVEVLVKKLCDENNWEYETQATVKKIEECWGIVVPTDKSERRYDFAINNNGKLLLAEVNYYNGGGSKLKTVANEFTKLDKYIEEGGFQFCWITDGLGWNTAKKPLRDAFDSMRHIFNLQMIENGALEYLVKNL